MVSDTNASLEDNTLGSTLVLSTSTEQVSYQGTFDLSSFEKAGTDKTTFTKLQQHVLPLINEWVANPASKLHFFYTQWEMWDDSFDEYEPFYIVK
jgi:hypothetical protein